mmetsp:Transcript_27724/g.27948  ORF Transcript_27724/g.27948 Transcript_27724/m.27948 type:complete len:225 (-) Transcript_27724:334-1008(-)|eukprot:CAMPEP_0182428850 /NCGR_PEP_ID=MMETSP1167-20130531/24176_1 /TAXON_ID=2988 /ORGANISM="Mallomonas Sp, Strain CCMP3275" /LENGTH=224 /DNA_ID=CAMNT_0024612015 /DNA_START=69 /DNA_END=743 /DNA_ORIENTATION=-
MSDSIQGPLNELIDILKAKAPHLAPAIFPTQYRINSIFDIISFRGMFNSMKDWIDSQDKDDKKMIMCTSIDYESRSIVISHIMFVDPFDAKLASVEKVMKALILGREDEISILVQRFLKLNNYKCNIEDGRAIFQEVYHVAYAIKVIISNIPGMKLQLGDYPLPLTNITDSEIKKMLDHLHCDPTTSSSYKNNSDSDAVIHGSEPSPHERKKRRRSSHKKSNLM